jgi:hypothetical protein
LLKNINILKRLPLFKSTLEGTSWTIDFNVNGNNYQNDYYLVDGIYPPWAMLIKPKGLLSANSVVKFLTKRQEALRKDIKQTFRILKACFQILKKPSLHWYPGDLTSIMNTCIILHNMIVKFQSPSKPPPELPD